MDDWGLHPWRPQGIQYRKNEVFLDVIEKVNLLIGRNGTILNSEITGQIKVKCHLSGMPQLRLGLNDRVQLFDQHKASQSTKGLALEDVKFHQCVPLTQLSDDVIKFIPPDGEFELLSYRLSANIKPLFLVEAIVESHAHSRVEYLVKIRSQYKQRSVANNVKVIIPVPPDADSPQFKASIGTVQYNPGQNCILWTIRQFSGDKEFSLRAHFGLSSITNEEADKTMPPISVEFKIPYFTVSGIQVRYLKCIEPTKYTPSNWVSYTTENGLYQIRTK